MKWSQVLHGISAIVGIAGGLALIAAWLAGAEGTSFGLSQEHLFSDAIALSLLSIAAGVGTLIHQRGYKST